MSDDDTSHLVTMVTRTNDYTRCKIRCIPVYVYTCEHGPGTVCYHGHGSREYLVMWTGVYIMSSCHPAT